MFVNLSGLGDTYTVKSGDTLNAIGARFGMTAQQIADLNNIEDVDSIDVGQVLQMPYGVVTATQIEEQTPVGKVVQAIAPQPAPLTAIASTAQKVASAITPTAQNPATIPTRKAVAPSPSFLSGISMSTVLMGGAAVALATALILIIKKRREGQ